MDIRDYKRNALDGVDMLISAPFVSTSEAMTLMYVKV